MNTCKFYGEPLLFEVGVSLRKITGIGFLLHGHSTVTSSIRRPTLLPRTGIRHGIYDIFIYTYTSTKNENLLSNTRCVPLNNSMDDDLMSHFGVLYHVSTNNILSYILFVLNLCEKMI